MADSTQPPAPANARDTTKPTPPSSPEPADGVAASGSKTARKREREVSLEPAPACVSSTAGSVNVNDQQAPMKKNKIALDAHPEEETSPSRSASRSRSNSPKGLSSSPRQEQAVRQIRRGVEDLTWQNNERPSPPNPTVDQQATDAPSDNANPVPKRDDADMLSVSGRSNSPASQKPASVVMGSASGSQPPSRRVSDASMKEEKAQQPRKRKLVDRGASEGPSTPIETLKRSRDDPDDDQNPREKKRPTPPPEQAPTVDATPRRSIDSLKRSREDDEVDQNPREPKRITPPPEEKPKKIEKKDVKPVSKGFMQYASATSPFASVKAPPIFGTTASPPPATPSIPSTPSNASTPSTSKDPFAKSGFARLVGDASPFATVARNKPHVFGTASVIERPNTPERSAPISSIKSTAFSAYATASPFAIAAKVNGAAGKAGKSDSSSTTPSTDEAENADEADKAKAFQDKLRAGKDTEGSDEDEKKAKLQLKEQEIMTGEEDEDVVFAGRGKLFFMDGDAYKERGTGIMKINVKREDRKNARIIMRKDTVHNLLLNVSVTSIAKCEVNKNDTRYLSLSVATGTGIDNYAFRMKETSNLVKLADAAKDPAAYLERNGGDGRRESRAAPRHRATAVEDAGDVV
ncbi:hypothetical protein GGG16DRAFT_48929 [Schizophyllum commune]